jgi:hypothetical protein
MNKRLLLVAALWVIQAIGAIAFVGYQARKDTERLHEYLSAHSKLLNEMSAEPFFSRERANDNFKLQAMSEKYETQNGVAPRMGGWIIYGILVSGVFVVLTMWATRRTQV